MTASEIGKMLEKARNAFRRGVTKDVRFRVQQLNNMYRMCVENEKELTEAVCQDLGKPIAESILHEMVMLMNEIRCMQQNIHEWVKPVSTEKSFINLLDKTFVQYEPYGVAFVLGAWNYPVMVTLCPVVGAIAAGNCVILKPSELAPKTAAVMKKLIPKYLDSECYHVVTGGPTETADMLKEEYDYIFYTGSTRVGQLVREAANKHLTPCTLELGGKSPVYIDDTVNLDVACRRLLWGKLINAGQTCLAPDFLMCTKAVLDRLIPVMKRVVKEFYGEDSKASADFGRILNEKHFRRLLSLLKNGDIAIGGEHDEIIRYIAPTVITNVKLTDPIMQEEIFGPLLPIITVEDLEEAIDVINSKDKALTINVYSKNYRTIRKFLDNTSSGSVCVNDSIVNLSDDALPFGGVGKSGIGAWRGKFSFETFSHKKAVLIRNYSVIAEKLGMARYPPYSVENVRYLRKLLRKRPKIFPSHLDYVGVFVLGFAFAVILKLILQISNQRRIFVVKLLEYGLKKRI